MEDLFQKIKDSWNNIEELQLLLVDIAEEYNRVGETYGNSTAEFAQSFISEKENSFKSTIAETEYRVKSSMGGVSESLKEKLVSLSLLFKAVNQRVDWLMKGIENGTQSNTESTEETI